MLQDGHQPHGILLAGDDSDNELEIDENDSGDDDDGQFDDADEDSEVTGVFNIVNTGLMTGIIPTNTPTGTSSVSIYSHHYPEAYFRGHL